MTALSVVGSVLSGVAQQALGNGVGFSLNAFLAAQSDGFAFDFTKTDRFFQENTGPTLADDVGEAIGLALSSRLWNGRTLAEELAQQPELVTNGTFDTDTLWGKSASVTISGGELIFSSSSAFHNGSVAIVLEAGKFYRVEYEVTEYTSGSVRAAFAGGTQVSGTTRSAVGTFVEYIAAVSGNNVLLIQAGGSGFTGKVDNVSCKLVPGKHATQATGSLKPTRQVFYGYSDDQPELVANGGFDSDSGWTKGTGWTISGGKAVQDGTGSSINGLLDSIATDFENAKTYRVEFTISEYTSGGVRSLIYGDGFVGIGPTRSANGTYVEVLTINNSSASATNVLRFQPYTASFAGKIDNVSVKEVPASRITTAAKGDGSDDNLLTTYTAGSGENFIVAYVNVPTTISSTQIIAGANDASSTNRWFIAVNTSGQLCGGVGGQSVSTILSTATDWRGKSVVVGISCNGTTARLFADNEIVYEAAQSGTPTASTPLRIGSNNAAGTAASFTAATVANVIAGPEYLDLATFLKIRNKLIDP